VADDQAINRKLTAHQLERLGFAVDVVENGRQAIDALSRTSYDLIFMDCHMPELDGFDATREIRSREGHTHHTPVIALTATVAEEDRNRCVAAGMDDYVVKPVSERELIRVLSHWLMDVPIDRDAIGRLQQIDPSVLNEVVGLFVADAPMRIASIREAMQKHDAGLLLSAAHALKSSSGNVGASRLHKMCADLERMARSGDLTSAKALADKLDAEFDRAVTALRQVRQE